MVLIHNLNRASLKTLNCALEISSNVTALHLSTTPRHTDKLVEQWAQLGIPLPLTVLDAPYRQIPAPAGRVSERARSGHRQGADADGLIDEVRGQRLARTPSTTTRPPSSSSTTWCATATSRPSWCLTCTIASEGGRPTESPNRTDFLHEKPVDILDHRDMISL